MQASREIETEIANERKSSTVAKKNWEHELVDYDTSKEEDEGSALDLSIKLTSSCNEQQEHKHCIAERPSCHLFEERNISTIEFVDDKEDTIQNIDYWEIKVPAKAMSRKMLKIVLHGPQILTTPLDKSQTVPSISDDDDGQKSFEDTCFSSEDEKVPDLILVVQIQTKRGRGRDHGRSTATQHGQSASHGRRHYPLCGFTWSVKMLKRKGKGLLSKTESKKEFTIWTKVDYAKCMDPLLEGDKLKPGEVNELLPRQIRSGEQL